ncbi:hypothetical protein [Acinetobacter sp. 1125_18A]|uniref:hypothetical protein n=1 Tax=Acinetobacter sp. 1125_18A TaxID=2605959 RepID=UPI004059F0AF
MLKRIMIFLVPILLLLNSALVNASIGGWTLSNPTAVGASILYDGTKGAATSSILISPNTSQVAKVLRGGLVGYALTFAVDQLLGAVDWVLDPANNAVKYKKIPDVLNSERKYTTSQDATYFYSGEAACRNSLGSLYVSYEEPEGFAFNGSVGWCNPGLPSRLNLVAYPNYPAIPNPEKYLSLITAAQQVIENAEGDNLDAQFAVLAAASNILYEDEQDDVKAKTIADELENNTKCPSGIVRNGSCWVCDKFLFMPYTRATRDSKTATRGKSCKNVTDTTVKATNATLFRNLINARVQENACWSPPEPNHAIALTDAQNALSLCEN